MRLIEACCDHLAGEVVFFDALTLGCDFQALAFKIGTDFTWHPWGWHGLEMEVRFLFFYISLCVGWMAEEVEE